MAPYWRRFGKQLWKDSEPWARDNIFWAGATVMVPPIAVVIRDPRHVIDWPVLYTALWLYGVTLGIYITFHVIRTVWKLDRELVEKIKKLNARLEVQVSISGLKDDDPRIEPSFVDGRRGLSGQPYLELKNKGNSIAYFVRLSPIKLKARTVAFPGYSDSIHPTDFRTFCVDAGSQWGEDKRTDLIRVMSEEWCAYADRDTRREVFVPVRIDFEDERGTRFECNFELMYHGGKGWNQLPTFNCIECRNLVYRRIPLGITLPE